MLKMNRRGKNPEDDLEFKGLLVSVFMVWRFTFLHGMASSFLGPTPFRISRMRSPD